MSSCGSSVSMFSTRAQDGLRALHRSTEHHTGKHLNWMAACIRKGTVRD